MEKFAADNIKAEDVILSALDCADEGVTFVEDSKDIAKLEALSAVREALVKKIKNDLGALVSELANVLGEWESLNDEDKELYEELDSVALDISNLRDRIDLMEPTYLNSLLNRKRKEILAVASKLEKLAAKVEEVDYSDESNPVIKQLDDTRGLHDSREKESLEFHYDDRDDQANYPED